MDLSAFFRSIPDPRRAQGLRYSLESMLWMSFLSIASGYTSYRQISNFCKIRKDFFMDYFSISAIPSYVSFRTIFNYLNNQSILDLFENECIKSLNTGDWLCGDGQTLGSTVVNSQNSSQDYCSIVSLYCQQSGLTVAMKEYLNKKDNEIVIFQELLDNLRDKGLIITLDALHCQKKL